MRNTLALAVLVLAAGQAAAVNKCVGPDGKVTYTESLCPNGTDTKGVVQGTGRAPDAGSGRARVLSNERQELSTQRERMQTESERLKLERDRAATKRDTEIMARQNSAECMAARESLRHLDNYLNRTAMRQACGLPEPASRPATRTVCSGYSVAGSTSATCVTR